MIHISVEVSVLEALQKAFPSPAHRAKRILDKYVANLELLINLSVARGRSTLALRYDAYDISLKKVGDKGGQIGSTGLRTHTWLKDNNIVLFKNVREANNLTGEVGALKFTNVVTIHNSKSLAYLRTLTTDQLHAFLNTLTDEDRDICEASHAEIHQLSKVDLQKQYDITPVHIESLKSYIRHIVSNPANLTKLRQLAHYEPAETILRIAQTNNGIWYQKKKDSLFGRTYYEGLSVQNIEKALRNKILGNCYEYDIKSSMVGWKMGFAQEWYDSKKRTKSFDDEFAAMIIYLEHKEDFFNSVLNATFNDQSRLSPEKQIVKIKEAMTALGFGAKLTSGTWFDDQGVEKHSSINKIIEDPLERARFMNHELVKDLCAEQSKLSQYIFRKFQATYPWLNQLSELKKGRSQKLNLSKTIAWLYQHAETIMMDMVRAEVKSLQKTLIASIHDAIVIREQLTDSERQAIEVKVRQRTAINYFRLGETELKVFTL